jgi:hypothetical protein
MWQWSFSLCNSLNYAILHDSTYLPNHFVLLSLIRKYHDSEKIFLETCSGSLTSKSGIRNDVCLYLYLCMYLCTYKYICIYMPLASAERFSTACSYSIFQSSSVMCQTWAF